MCPSLLLHMIMRLINVLLLCFSFCVLINAQQKEDYVWILGDQPGFTGLRFDFNKTPFEAEERFFGLDMDQNNASICDDNGNLLFYTNGCAVANMDHEIMENGDSINAGFFFDQLWLGDCENGYPGRQDIMVLPDPSNGNGYYIIHKTVEYDTNLDPSLFLKYLKYSYVNLGVNNGKGKVAVKNVVFYDGVPLSSYLTAITHTNGNDYWIIQPETTNNSFLVFLLDSTGINLVHELDLGLDFHPMYSSAAGDSKFSPDGKKYGYYNKTDGFWLFDFDRTTGILENPNVLNQEMVDGPLFSTMEFSSNSEFV